MTSSIRLLLILGLLGACKNPEKFESLGLRIAGPADVAASSDGAHFYVLNSDFDRTFNQGSILVMDEQGTKKAATSVPRLGRSLDVAGTRMIATFDGGKETASGIVQIYDLTDPLAPALGAQFNLDCAPINAIIHKSYNHFAVSCFGGDLYLGTIKSPLANSDIKWVRTYRSTRRAMILDPIREVLYAFSTDIGRPNSRDMEDKDETTYLDGGIASGGPNDIPDTMENSTRKRRRKSGWETYQFVVYDIAAERNAGFPKRLLDDPKDPTADNELRWMYFSLFNVDGQPDRSDGVFSPALKTYRTNFWEAKPDLTNPNVFYLSHRGAKDGGLANNIVKVTLTGSPLVANGVAPLTASFLSFERVYGFTKEVDQYHHVGDFELLRVDGQDVVIANHFRDLVFWKRENQRFSVVAKTLDQSFWLAEVLSNEPEVSYYQVAGNTRGKVFSCSFYGNSVLMLDVNPGTGITVSKIIH